MPVASRKRVSQCSLLPGRRQLQDGRALGEAQSLPDDPLICGVDATGGGAAWNVMAFHRGGDARSIPRIRIPGEHTSGRSVLVGKLAEILRDMTATPSR